MLLDLKSEVSFELGENATERREQCTTRAFKFGLAIQALPGCCGVKFSRHSDLPGIYQPRDAVDLSNSIFNGFLMDFCFSFVFLLMEVGSAHILFCICTSYKPIVKFISPISAAFHPTRCNGNGFSIAPYIWIDSLLVISFA